MGYTIILLLDKVAFDAQAVFNAAENDNADPAAK